MFTEVQIYCKKGKCCFDDILKSKKPKIIINTLQVSSLEPKTDWGFCDNHEKYPYRVLNMANGDKYLCVLESANDLEKLLINNEGK